MSEAVRFGTNAEATIAGDFALPQMRDLLGSLQRPLPHLAFGPWEVSRPPPGGVRGPDGLPGSAPNEVRVRVRLAPGVGLASRVNTLGDLPVPPLDREALRTFADFVGTLVESLGVVSRNAAFHRRSTEILPANIDIGSLAVGRYLRSMAHLPFDPTPVLLHLRALSQQTYEGQKIAYGLMLTRRQGEIGQFPADVGMNKRFRAVSDGEHTALQLDKEGKVLGLAALTREEGGPVRAHRPSIFDALATGSANQALGIGLSEEGDIVCLQKANMVVSLRQGQWQVWNHLENVAVLRRAIEAICPKPKARGKGKKNRDRSLELLSRALYGAAIDLSFRRRGALFVVVEDARALPGLIDEVQRPGHDGRAVSDLALDLTLRRHRSLLSVPREVLVDLAGLDGAVLVGSNAQMLAYGAIIKLSPEADTSRGARFQACLEASAQGVALMVSADGGISIVSRGKMLLRL